MAGISLQPQSLSAGTAWPSQSHRADHLAISPLSPENPAWAGCKWAWQEGPWRPSAQARGHLPQTPRAIANSIMLINAGPWQEWLRRPSAQAHSLPQTLRIVVSSIMLTSASPSVHCRCSMQHGDRCHCDLNSTDAAVQDSLAIAPEGSVWRGRLYKGTATGPL